MKLQEKEIRIGRLRQRGFVGIGKSRNFWKKIREFVEFVVFFLVYCQWTSSKIIGWGKRYSAERKKGVYGEVCWLCNTPSNTTYVGHFHFLYVINAVNSESSLVNEAVKTGVGGDQQNLCKQIVVTCHLTSTFLQFMDTKNDEHRGNTKHWIMFPIIIILCWFQKICNL